ncbi:MAG: VIT family protein [Candidatus Levybacteria bacterium]|nr:VIT family protein [Candidatus Levybacteria bacterium]
MNKDISLSAQIHSEPHISNHTAKLNWLRASVLGANDGIVSIAGLVVGVASATNSPQVIVTAGMAGIIAGAISMAVGEYVSVSSSRDTERALLEEERKALLESPEQELQELASIYEHKGLSRETAMVVAKELSDKDAFAAHVDAELGIDPDNLTNPWHAAFASSAAFLSGALIPLVAVLLPPSEMKVPVTFVSVLIALVITGTLSAKVSGANPVKATIRIVSGGALAMIITYGVGQWFGVAGV